VECAEWEGSSAVGCGTVEWGVRADLRDAEVREVAKETDKQVKHHAK